MRKVFSMLFILSFIAIPFNLQAGHFEWQLAAGTWSLKPFTSPVTTAATKLVNDEAEHLLAPILSEVNDLLAPYISEYVFLSFAPNIKLDSYGYFFTAAAWYKLAAGKFALGASAGYLDFTLPFVLTAGQDLYIYNIPIAHIDLRSDGHINLRTIMLKAQGRWRISQGRRISTFVNFGLTLMPFTGDLYLPLTATIDSILGSMEFNETETATIAQLRAENSDIPALIIFPSLAVSLHYRLNKSTRLFIELNLSSGTFISAGLAFGR